MEKPFEKLHEINEYLVKNANEATNLGLMNGKLGLCIYYYHLARVTGEERFLEVAENLIGEVFEKIGEVHLSMDFESGLAGIGWGISFLVNSGFVEADLGDTLSDLDDQIFKFLEDQKGNLPANVRNGLIGYIFYCFDRLESSLKSGHNSNVFIFHRLGAQLLNQLGQLIEEEKLQDREPQLFSIFWDLPILLIVLAKSKKLQVNPAKADRILEYILPTLISLFPNLHSNRLYLLLGIESYLKECDHPILNKHASFLKENIVVKTIFNEECKNLNIFIENGVSGLMMIIKMLIEINKENSLVVPDEFFLRKINESVCWEDREFYNYLKKSIGLVSGFAGIGFVLSNVLQSMNKSETVNIN